MPTPSSSNYTPTRGEGILLVHTEDLASKAPSLGSVDLQGLTILDDGALLCVSTYIPSGLV